MNSDIESLAKIMNGFRNGKEKLYELRVRDIRNSDIRKSVGAFNGLFEHGLANMAERQPTKLSRAMRAYLGLEA